MNAKKKRKSKHPFAVHVMWFLLFIIVAFMLRIASQGLPEGWVNAMAEAVSTDKFAFEFDRVSISLRRGELDIGHISVFPKGIVHEAILEMDNTSVKLRPKPHHSPLTWIRAVRVDALTLPASVLDIGTRAMNDEDVFRKRLDADEPPSGYAKYVPEFGPMSLRCGTLNVFGTTARRIETTVSASNDTLFLDDISINVTRRREYRQEVTGDLEFGLESMSLVGNAAGKIDPTKILPIFSALDLPEIASEIDRFRFPDTPPDVQVKINYRPSENLRDVSVQMQSDYCLYNGTALTFCSGILRATGTNDWRSVIIEPLQVVRPEGVANGSLTISGDKLTFQVASSIDPLHMLRIIRVAEGEIKLPMTFDNPSELIASGTFDFATNASQTSISGILRTPSINACGVKFEHAIARCRLSDLEWSVTNFTADVLGGRVDGAAVFTPTPTNKSHVVFSSQGKFSDLNHSEWSTLFGTNVEDDSGKLDLQYELGGPILTNATAFLAQLHGAGSLGIRKGRLYRIPLFAGLTEFLASNVPGVDFVLSQDDMSASISYTNRVLTIKNLKIEGNVFSASGYGTLNLDGEVNLMIKGHLLNQETWVGKGLYYVLFPLSKILEFQAKGPYANPKWTSATFTNEALPVLPKEEASGTGGFTFDVFKFMRKTSE